MRKVLEDAVRPDSIFRLLAGFNRNSTTLIAKLKRIKAVSALRHSVRILTIVAKASFWALCYHYFGSKTLLYAVASWTFLLGIRDITFARVRLTSLKNPKKLNRALFQSVSVELALILMRLGAIFALAAAVAPFNKFVAATIPIMAVVTGFWARETFIAIASAFGTGKLRLYVSFASSIAALGSILYFAENGFEPIHSAIWAMMVREGLTFFGFAGVALLGCLGLRSRAGAGADDEDEDDDDGSQVAPIVTPDGREVRSAWKMLIADNVIYSRWRMMNFATRFVAHGILGPFGGIGARIFFSYRQPKPYKHHQDRLAFGRIGLIAIAAISVISAVVFLAERAALLHAIGIALAAFVFRIAALSANLLFWRQLSPIVGSPKKTRLVNDQAVVIAQEAGATTPPSRPADPE